MTRTITYGTMLALVMISGLIGWLQAGTGSVSVNASQNEWRTPSVPGNGAGVVAALQERLLGSGFFEAIGGVAKDIENQTGGGNSGVSALEKQYGRFPHIISISRIDGRDTAQLRLADNAIITVYAGDVLQSGWIVTRINSDHLQADAGSDSFSFAVFEHKDVQDQGDGDK